MHIAIDPVQRRSGDGLASEIVERKGLGHPDTICDEIAEDFSLALSRYYLREFGEILHHNVDKVLLAAGTSNPALGGGEIMAPMRIILAGRATTAVGHRQVPVDELARQAVSDWFATNLPLIDLERDVKVQTLVHPGSADLNDLFARRSTNKRLANDTSCGVGYAPLSTLESVVAAVERDLGLASAGGRLPAIGRDIKVMGLRQGRHIHLTVGCAMIGRFIPTASDYMHVKNEAARIARRSAATTGAHELVVEVNVADDPAKESFFLTVTGTSAEAGDDGEAGRGNRANGLITPHRAMTMESVAGKNPMTHVGKLYNLAAGLIAESLVNDVPGLLSAEVCLVSQIGRPLTYPTLIEVRATTHDGRASADLTAQIEAVVDKHMCGIETLWRDLISGTVRFGRWPLRQ